ncbi:DUF86 domain-containing protein [bacterium]|nr:DUF86 domain-containing protein [bacterium]
MKDERVYLSHILKCIARLEEEVARGEAEFRASETVRDAVLMNLATMGEAIKRLSAETRGLGPGLPWSQITKLRDVIIHRYDRLDLHEIWDIARLDVPPFKAQVEELLQQMSARPMQAEGPETGGPGNTEG